MDNDDTLATLLNSHPIFSTPSKTFLPSHDPSLELSTNTLSSFKPANVSDNTATGRRQVMVLRDTDLILAAGKELRMTSLSDAKARRSHTKNYKTLHTPNIQFKIDQITLNSSGKLLAVAGAFQLAVVVLPRAGYSRLVPDIIDCKSIQIGQFYHGSDFAVPIAKIEWHPWGEAGSTLMVMTIDGKLREYDISVDTEEPQQVLTFAPEKKAGRSFVAEDASEREVVSFTLGKGKADWGPLTVYAVMRSGDVYSMCPYMPQNSSIPSAYIHSLECFISAKQEFLAQGTTTQANRNMSMLYDYQHKYVDALLKQLPPGTVFPAPSRSILIHPPTIIKAPPARQGPFLLQPSPRMLDESEGGDATDIVYLSYSQTEETVSDAEDGVAENLDIVLITYQDGKIDVCLDVEKVEARWQSKVNANHDLPMLAVYECIDLGLISLLNSPPSTQGSHSALDLIQGNYPVFSVDPIHSDTIYVYHAFGVHALYLRPTLEFLFSALHSAGAVLESSESSSATAVQSILSTFSVERKSSNPVIALAIPDDVYLSYSIYILTSAMRITSFSLNPRPESPLPKSPAENNLVQSTNRHLELLGDTPPYTSLLGTEPWMPPSILSRNTGLPFNPRLSLPKDASQREFMLTPDTLRYLATVVTRYSDQVREVELAQHGAEGRAALQIQEVIRQTTKCRELLAIVERIKESRREASQDRIQKVQQGQKILLKRLDRMLQVMMEKASPELSEHETKWFDELKRLKEAVIGADRYDESSLSTRIRTLEREYARLMPSLKALLEKERRRHNQAMTENPGLGFSQAFEFGERSNHERARLTELEQDVIKLAAKLDVTLGKPPLAK
ncbi:hypothetical protein F5876DRAFT_45305 [Lentinula aff. lateritia]|uniref:Uncharacterized protein n=1 Tax=Lentinula aff. lateritia TaxID=2804960 RepID=A0ACC1TVI3_9AGAR|nr:hypothetical protein F5876DRAFT_45305 [Lentinula aff. lateritia]